MFPPTKYLFRFAGSKLIGLFCCMVAITNISFAQTSSCVGGDCLNGLGTYVFSDKAEYTGQWVSGQRTGIGCYDWSDGSYYLGNFVNGKLEGLGIYIGNDDDETTLVGMFHDGKFSESRSMETTGCLIGNCYEGVGIYLWTNDDLYVGEWHQGIRTGYGRFDWADGSFYTGYFKDNLLDGRGYYWKKGGTVMDGYFDQNQYLGKTNTKEGQNLQSNSAAPVQNYAYSTYDDVCSLLQKVIKSYASEFNDIKGAFDENAILSGWESTVSLKGSLESGLDASLYDDDVAALWYDDIGTFTDVKQAMDKYNELVDDFKKCQNYCCSFKQSSTSTANEKYTTIFEPDMVSSGYSSDYNDMQIIIELSYAEYSKNWSIELQVYNKNTF